MGELRATPGGKSPANIMHHLKGINFPASKADIIKKVKENQEIEDTSQVLGILEQIEDKEYVSPAEIMKEVGRIE